MWLLLLFMMITCKEAESGLERVKITCKEAESGLDRVRAGVAADGGRVE